MRAGFLVGVQRRLPPKARRGPARARVRPTEADPMARIPLESLRRPGGTTIPLARRSWPSVEAVLLAGGFAVITAATALR